MGRAQAPEWTDLPPDPPRHHSPEEDDAVDTAEHIISSTNDSGLHYNTQLWIDLPLMVSMLMLGILALYLDSGSADSTAHINPVLAWLLPAAYLASIILRVGFLGFTSTRNYRQPHAARSHSRVLLVTTGFIIDIIFLIGIMVLTSSDRSTVLAAMMIVAVAWLLKDSRSLWLPLITLVTALPVVVFFTQWFYTPNKRQASLEEIAYVLLVVASAVLLGYTLRAQRRAKEAELTEALLERDRRLEDSRISLKQTSRYLAEQLLRLDLLQDGIRAINSAIEVDELLQMIVNNTLRVLKVEQSSVGLIDKATGELVIRSIAGVYAQSQNQRRFPLGVGVAGWVAQHGKPLMVKDVRDDPYFIDFYKAERQVSDAGDGSQVSGVGDAAPTSMDDALQNPRSKIQNPDGEEHISRSMLCVPLIVEGEVIGTLCVSRSLPNSLTSADQNLLMSFAEQVALAVHKSQMLDALAGQRDEIKQNVEVLSTLQSIAQGVLSSLDLPDVLNTIANRISELSNFEYGVIYLVNERTDTEELVATSGKVAHSTDLELRPGTPGMELWKRARLTGKPQWSTTEISTLCLPLVNRGKVLGCIMIARGGSLPFTAGERDIAEKLADAATIAIVNARLFTRVSTQQEQTSAMYRLMTAINASTNRRYLAGVICQELHQVTRAQASALLVLDHRQHRFAAWAGSGNWETAAVERVAQTMQSDSFVHGTLAALHQMGDPSLLIIPQAPYEISQAFGSKSAITIPLVLGGRLFGLFVMEPITDPPVPEELLETISLITSRSAMALERAELFEQAVAAARQSSLLYKFAVQVQPVSDPTAVIQLTADYLLEAMPLKACEVYIFEEDRERLVRAGSSVSRGKNAAVLSADEDHRGPDTISARDIDVVTAVASANLVIRETERPGVAHISEAEDAATSKVVFARLMGSERALGIVRLTTAISSDEFVRHHATFCQTLLTHSGGALERSRLYSTVANQARMLRQMSQQLGDILDMGRLSSTNVPLSTLLPEIAQSVVRSLHCDYVRLGEIGPGSNVSEIWAYMEQGAMTCVRKPSSTIPVDDLARLMEVGRPTLASAPSVYLDEAVLNRLLSGQPQLQHGQTPHQLILMPLEARGGDTLGYIMVALSQQPETPGSTNEDDWLEVLSAFGQRTSILIENHRVYNELLESKRKIETVVLSISDGVIVTDANLDILITNNLADGLLGVPVNGAAGLPLRTLVNNSDLIMRVEECIATSRTDNMEIEFTIDREQRFFETVVHPIAIDKSEVIGVVITLLDVTAERILERTKSDFVSIVSHELRTPLNSVLGFLDILLSGRTGELNEIQLDFLATAKQEGGVLKRLISDILDYSQLQSGMLRVETAPTNLSFLVDRVANQWTGKLEGTGVQMVNNVPAGLVVLGDELRLTQVFNNLIDNAAKFTRSGEIRLDCQLRGDNIVLSVADTGVGIAPSQVNSIFDRFFQAENNRELSKRGLGLGLAICKNIIEAHEGEIWARSEVGMGTTIYVRLPMAVPPEGTRDILEEMGLVLYPVGTRTDSTPESIT